MSYEHKIHSLESNSTEIAAKRSAGGITLVPQPSDDRADPLNWTLSKKVMTLFIFSFASYIGKAQALANQSGLPLQAKVYAKTPIQISYSNSASIVGLAVGPVLLWMPLSKVIGRTSCIFWGMIATIACNIWSACMTGRNDYIPFVLSRWLAGTFGSVATTMGAGMILETFFLHQRGKAFTFYTMSTGFGAQSGTTFSGFIANSSAWPVQFWWTVAVEVVVVLLVAFFLDDTGFSCEDKKRKLRRPKSWIMCRLAILSPYKNFTSRESSYWKAITPTVLISICPVTILTGIFIMVAFGWSVATTVLLSIFLQTPIEEGGYGFSALQNAAFTFSAWLGTVIGQIYGILVNDRIPLWLCRRHGGIWKPEFRLTSLILPPGVLLPVGLGLYGASLQYHLHYMVLALSMFIIIFCESALLPIAVNYVAESFTGYASEVLTILNCYRLVLGLLVPFFVDGWKTAVGPGWVFGSMALFTVAAFLLLSVVAYKGETIRRYSVKSIRSSEEGVTLH